MAISSLVGGGLTTKDTKGGGILFPGSAQLAGMAVYFVMRKRSGNEVLGNIAGAGWAVFWIMDVFIL